MKVQSWMRAAGVAVAAMLAVFGPCGCNDDDGGGSDELDGYFASHPFLIDGGSGATSAGGVSIDPTSVTLNQAGAKVVFGASGGNGSYTWDALNTSIGTVSGSGDRGTYTALQVGNNSVIVYDSDGGWAVATISGSAADLKATADPDTLETDFTYSTLTASGGQPPYTWTAASSGSRGSIVGGSTGPTVVYQRLAMGDNYATVTDDLGNKASVIIKQP